MNYTLKVSQSKTSLLQNEVEDWNKTGTEDLLLEYKSSKGLASESYSLDLTTALVERYLELTKKGFTPKLYLRPQGLSSTMLERNLNIAPVLIDLEGKSPKSLNYSIQYLKTGFKEVDGVSDYSYLSDFMPAWSTARKFPLSNHARTVEPFFSNIEALPSYIRARLQGYSYQEDSFTAHRKAKEFKIEEDTSTYKLLSKLEEDYLIEEVYKNNEEKTLDFGYTFNTIYIEVPGYEHDFELTVEGEYNSSWFSERVLIDSKGVYELKNPYHKIHNIFATPNSLLDLSSLEVNISNHLTLDSFKYEARETSDLNYTGTSINSLRRDSKQSQVFNLDIVNLKGLFVTKDDHILAYRQSKLYTSKLDLKIDLPIPLDITYNNSKFIEECELGNREYELELFLSNYLKYTGQDVMAIRVETSEGSVFYLNEYLELIPSGEPIYLDSSLTKDSKSVTLSLDLNTEYVVVRLEDYENKYLISHLVYEPRVEFKPVLDWEDLSLEHVIEEAYPIILEGQVWLRVVVEGSYLYRSVLIPLEPNFEHKKRMRYEGELII